MLRRWLGKDLDTHRLLVSLWSSLGFVGLGASALVFGPTLLDLGASIGVGVAVMSAMFGARASGAALGSIVLGYLMDKWKQFSYTILTLVLAACIITTVLVPVASNVYMLAFFMLCNGVAMGSQDSATHALLMRLWKENSGPCMQILHFAYAFGAFLAPLVAKQFITEDTSGNTDITTQVSLATPTYTIANDTLPDDAEPFQFKYAYWILSLTHLPTLIAYVYFSVKYDYLKKDNSKSEATMVTANGNAGKVHYKRSKHSPDREIEMEQILTEPSQISEVSKHEPSASDEESSSSEKEELIFMKKSSDKTKESPGDIERSILSSKSAVLTRYKYAVLLLLATFMFVYVGLEVAYGSLIFTATVLGPLQFSKHQASLIQAVFWGVFAFGRLFSIVLVFIKVRSSIMISMNLTGSLVASIIMIAFIHSAPAIWIASVVLGASYSSIYPTAMTWMSENVEATGLATAILITGGVLGDIILPAVVGAVIAAVSPDMLFYLTFIGVVISGSVAAGMFWTAHKKRKHDLHSSPGKGKTLQLSNGPSSKEEKVKLMEVREHSDEEEDESREGAL